MVGKRLELLRDAVPGFSRVGVILAPDYATADGTLKALHPAAHGWGLQARVYEVRSGSRVGSRIRGGLRAVVCGHPPGDLPIERAVKFELVVNLKSSSQFGPRADISRCAEFREYPSRNTG
jgi:ABC-type uncharacterized transport system substrate-binding protein